MAEVAKSGAELLREIHTAAPPPGTGVFWWLGQLSIVVKAGGAVIYLDPFFDPWDRRQTPPPIRLEDPVFADLVTVSHGHADHLSPASLRSFVSHSPHTRFIAPRALAGRMMQEGGVPQERLISVNAGETVEVGSIRVTALKSKHEFFDEDPALGFPYLGYVVQIGGVTFYHSGDTINYEGLLTSLRQWPRLDAVFIPINGRDAERYLRGTIGNMTFQEATELAGELKVGLAVPAHYDMFVGNQEDPQKFVRFLKAKYPSVPCWVGPAGQMVPFPARA